jgi:hypothetical protein
LRVGRELDRAIGTKERADLLAGGGRGELSEASKDQRARMIATQERVGRTTDAVKQMQVRACACVCVRVCVLAPLAR